VAVVLGGSILTAADEAELLDAGVAAVFGPATTNLGIVDGVGDVVAARRRRLAVAAG
jgi:methylmalonyl-CoA mutase cobalamin-binding subunit